MQSVYWSEIQNFLSIFPYIIFAKFKFTDSKGREILVLQSSIYLHSNSYSCPRRLLVLCSFVSNTRPVENEEFTIIQTPQQLNISRVRLNLKNLG